MVAGTGMHLRHDTQEKQEQRPSYKAGVRKKNQTKKGSSTINTPLQGSSESINTKSSYNSFEQLMEFNTEDEDYEEINNGEVDMYAFEVKSLNHYSILWKTQFCSRVNTTIVEKLFTSSRMKTAKNTIAIDLRIREK
jgi:hypothetical protein